MTRRPMIAGNWKLHGTVAESVELAGGLAKALGDVKDCDLVVAPTYPSLYPVAESR